MTSLNSLTAGAHQQAALELIAQLNDPTRALADAKLEDDAGSDISAGHDWGDQLGRFMAEPAGFHSYQRLRALVMDELKVLLEGCSLGAGLPAALKVGRQLLSKRLKQPSSEVQSRLATVLDELLIADSNEQSVSGIACNMLRETIYSVLLEEDWDEISMAATTALQQHFRTRIALPKTA